jgi:hypothetical protein
LWGSFVEVGNVLRLARLVVVILGNDCVVCDLTLAKSLNDLTIAKASASVKATILTPTDNLVKRFTLGFNIVVDCINSTTAQTPIRKSIFCLVRKFLSAFELAKATLDRIEVANLKI